MNRLFATAGEHSDQKLGLNLALLVMIMDAHSGKLEAGNNPDGGAFIKPSIYIF